MYDGCCPDHDAQCLGEMTQVSPSFPGGGGVPERDAVLAAVRGRLRLPGGALRDGRRGGGAATPARPADPRHRVLLLLQGEEAQEEQVGVGGGGGGGEQLRSGEMGQGQTCRGAECMR